MQNEEQPHGAYSPDALPKKFPTLMIERFRRFLCEDDVRKILASYASERDAAFRVNTLKSSTTEIEAELSARGVRFERFQAIDNAYVVPKSDEYRLKGAQAFYDGKMYVQGITSQMPPLFLGIDAEKAASGRVLDVCAAPGSKTTQISAIMRNAGEVVALEKSPIRYDKLMHNVRLQGATNVHGVRADALEYLADPTVEAFDAILLDAPCSAEGRMRLDDERTYAFWNMRNTQAKAALQYELLDAALGKLKKGGALVYSTCTISPEENEGVVSAALDHHPDVAIEPVGLDIPESRPGITAFGGTIYRKEVEKTLRILPGKVTEGFYIAKFVKKGG